MAFVKVSVLVTIHTFEDDLIKLFMKLIDKIAGQGIQPRALS